MNLSVLRVAMVDRWGWRCTRRCLFSFVGNKYRLSKPTSAHLSGNMKLSERNTDYTAAGEQLAVLHVYISLCLSPSLPVEANMYIWGLGSRQAAVLVRRAKKNDESCRGSRGDIALCYTVAFNGSISHPARLWRLLVTVAAGGISSEAVSPSSDSLPLKALRGSL